MVSDPVFGLAQHLVLDAARRSPNLVAYLLTKSHDLPDEPGAAAMALQGRWPDLTEEDRRAGFAAACGVLNAISRECIESVERLDLLSGETGRG
ncbi:hypothetical protein CIW48_19785 [Methylobacterium sp. P1-11]|uniref:hypothetical protein n=1 Tax=Methylobacterium sp. P1-11 TaxID=2024616 RepID=UPI0011EF0519|nr:hypothetical protein [Methylobacterium sp. P1-11]KAA0122234.1 hypothetical protein CIW48_19785 [Methylobacterium sp. P1-11]